MNWITYSGRKEESDFRAVEREAADSEALLEDEILLREEPPPWLAIFLQSLLQQPNQRLNLTANRIVQVNQNLNLKRVIQLRLKKRELWSDRRIWIRSPRRRAVEMRKGEREKGTLGCWQRKKGRRERWKRKGRSFNCVEWGPIGGVHVNDSFYVGNGNQSCYLHSFNGWIIFHVWVSKLKSDGRNLEIITFV